MHSVRLRIALIAAVTTAVAIALAGLLLVGQLQASLHREIDESLERQALNFEQQVEAFDSFDTASVPVDPETLFLVLDPAGELLLTNDGGADGAEVASQLSFDFGLQEQVRFAELSLMSPTETTGVASMRAAYYELFLTDQFDDEQFFVVVARSAEPADRTVSALRRAVLIGIPLLAAFVAGLAWWLTGRSLRPVDVMRRQVDEISAVDLSRRVSEPRSTDEIGQLAATMNSMLERLDRSQKSQEQFVSDAAHELRTPLASIAAQLDVDNAHPSSADRVVTAGNVRGEVTRLQSLIDGLLASARNQDAKQQVEMPAVLLDLDVVAATSVARVARPNHVAVDQRGISVGTIRGDEPALASAIDNLLANAFRHAVSLVAVAVGTDEAGVWLTVDDDGTGVALANRERIFDRFVRLDEARSKDAGGSGLGLALARETAQRHNGSLQVEESALGGARFVLRLPAA